MTTIAKNQTGAPRIDPEALFKRLGLTPADDRPIMEPWREANRQWRLQHAGRIDAHSRRIQARLRRYVRRPTPGRSKAVWCVELRRRFKTMTAAANFVGKSVSNIIQSVKRGVRCGTFHWEEFDAMSHRGDW